MRIFIKYKKHIAWITLITLVLSVKLLSLFPDRVENWYSQGIYPVIAKCQRLLLGWIPFSVGDLLYLLVIVFIVRRSLSMIKRIKNRQVTAKILLYSARRILFIGLIIYVSFNIAWGLNYNRIPMAEQFNLEKRGYSIGELEQLMLLLSDSLNALDAAGLKRPVTVRKAVIFKEAFDTYQQSIQAPLHTTVRSLKPSLFSYLTNYTGISGYYNPFTGEAQVNTTIPAFLQPFVACHEIGHQLGYAKEDEANFAGFLSAKASGNPLFRYSAYFDMYAYTRREMYLLDSLRMKNIQDRLRPGVKKDIRLVQEFARRHENPLEPLITKLYGEYLKANEQPQGIKSYNEVVAMLVVYYRKEGIF